ncbi:MAG: peptidylprolyl isomerase [Candidatus Bathyarchaeota archaeon]|nr:peptidylprolyl isomerase [Candidatus Bathyarchaeota archaeon]
MSIEKGDFVLVDYVTKIDETGEIFDTTLEEEAKTGGIFKGDALYEPMLIVVGEAWVLKELDQSLIGLEVETPTVIEIPPEKGFGLRDPSKIRLVPVRRFRNKKVNLYPGAQIDVDGNMAVVRSVGSGRVQLDFNPPLAGKTLIYDLTVKSKLEDEEEKIIALIHRRIPSVAVAEFKVQIDEKEISIDLPEDSFYLEGVQYAKRGIASDIQRFFPRFEKIMFVESFIKAAPAPDEKPLEPEAVQEDTESDQ